MKIKVYVDMIKVPVVPWTPPPVGTLMVNVDATLFLSSRSMGSGVVIRDYKGNCAAARCDNFPNVQIPELAGALAVPCALVFAQEEGMDNICVATDCLSVVPGGHGG
uniref:Uncharacterized protein n=1 Tax=Avena sativa TaxID=4498 RepID=A0ACD5VF65_AVESA